MLSWAWLSPWPENHDEAVAMPRWETGATELVLELILGQGPPPVFHHLFRDQARSSWDEPTAGG
jgi:hypothetical protein